MKSFFSNRSLSAAFDELYDDFEPLFSRSASIIVALSARTNEPRPRLSLVRSPEEAEASEGGEVVASHLTTSERGNQNSQRRGDTDKKWSPSGVSAVAERTDEELVALARAGQPHAFEALYRRHSAYVLALAVRVQGNATDVEDIVHDAFLRVHDRLDDLRSGASFRPWLSSVVVSLVRTRLRRRRMLGVLGLSTAEPIDLDAIVTPDAGPEVRAQLAQIYSVLRTVSVDQSICWTLRYVEGRKLEEVAAIAGCSLATAKRRIASVQHEIMVSDARSVFSGQDQEGGHV